MNKVSYLGELEQMILLAVLRLGEGAYGVAIRQELEARTGRTVARGAVYVTLDRLERKGYLESTLGEPTARRGGRAKRFFRLRESGREALRTSRQSLLSLWKGHESLLEKP